MDYNSRRSSLWIVILALVAPLIIIGSFFPNFNRSEASSSRKRPLVLKSNATRPAAFTNPLIIPPVLTGANITLEARQAPVQVLNGGTTQMWTYNGIFPGPTIRRTTGQTTQITLVNNLPEAGSLSLHHHGAHTVPESDGQPSNYLVAPGATRTYTYAGIEDNTNERGAMHWYHDHMMDMTGHNVWMGLAGMYIVDDPADPQTLPSGEFDVPIMLLDRSFDADNQLIYQFDQNGVQGDTLLANGVVQPYFEVGSRTYRFRILNASNFSDMDLEMSNGQPMVQIGTESGLLPAPVSRQRILLGPAERADIVIDFAGQLGQNIVLLNRAGKPGTDQIMQFRVTRNLTDTSTIPPTLRPLPDLGAPVLTRTFTFGHTDDHWTINQQVFDADRVDAQPVLGTTERWILQNPGPDEWAHVVHIHLTNQQIVSRNGGPPAPYELMKESWYLNPGDTIELLLKFTDYTGRFVFHCHLLEHEDDRMMSQFELFITAPTPTITRTPTQTATRTRTPNVTFTATRTATFTPAVSPTGTCPPATPTTSVVSIVNFAFNPQNLTINRGSTVRWTNTANRRHTSASDTGVWDSGNIGAGQSFSFTFNTTGSFAYHCNVHPNMRAVINVIAPACATNVPTATTVPTRTNTFTPTLTRTRTATPTSTPTFTRTPTAIPPSILVGHITWQDIPQNDPRSMLPVTLTLKLGAIEVNYPQQNTDASGYFTASVLGLPNGVFTWRVMAPDGADSNNTGPGFLANSGTGILVGVYQTNLETGILRGGDADNNNTVNASDFNILKQDFGRTGILRSDFDNNQLVNTIDFTILKDSFGQEGAPGL